MTTGPAAGPPRRRWRERAEWIWAPALYVAVVLLLYREVWLGLGGALRWFGWDCLETYWPDVSYLASSLRAGDWPLWNPYDRGGYPFYGDPQPGLYYPPMWAAAIPGALAGAVPPWVIQAKALLHHAAAGAALHAYLRSRRLPAAAAVVGGVAWIVSAPLIHHKASNVIWPLVWAPLVWLAIDRLIERAAEPGWWRRAAGLAGAVALAGLAGSPPGFFYVLLTAAPYGLYRLAGALLDAGRRRELRAVALAQARGLGTALVAAGALLAVYLVPVAELTARSPRAERTVAYALSNPLPVGRSLVGMISPPLVAHGHLYLGLLVLVLAVVALAARPREDRLAPVFFGLAAAFALCLSFGPGTPLLPALVRHVPGFGLFREANRYKLPGALLFAALAAHGVGALLEEDRGRRRRALLAAAGATAALLATLLVLHATRSAPPRPRGDPGPAWTGSLVALGGVAAVVAALALLPRRLRPLGAAAAVAVAYLDVASFAQGSVRITEAPVDDRADLRHLAGLPGVDREWRIYDEYVLEQRPGSRLRVRDFRGYPSGDPLDDVRYGQVLKLAERTPEILEAFNVRWVLHGAHHRNGTYANHLKQPPSRTAPGHFRALDGRRHEARHPVPAAAWYGAVRLVSGGREALGALGKLEDAEGVRRAVVVERPDVPAALRAAIERLAAGPEAAAPPLVAGRITRFEADRVIFEIDVPAAGLVVLNEVHYPGWTVSVDGRRATPLRASFLLRGVVVETPGRHVVEWRFAPPAYPWLLAAWLAGAALLVAAASSALRRRTESPRARTEAATLRA